MSKKPVKTGGIYRNRSDYFQKGKFPSLDTDKQNYAGELQDGYSYVAHQDSPDPVAFTQSKTARKGGGFDFGEKRMIYKKVEPKEAPVQQAAPAPEPEDSVDPIDTALPVEHSDEIKQAVERVKAYENDVMSGKTSEDIFGAYKMDGSAGSQFSTDESQAATTTKPDAQDFADKYKLNLLNKGEGQTDFSGV